MLLGMVATSVPSERAFSGTGAIHTKQRYLLSAYMLDDLTYIRANLPSLSMFDAFLAELFMHCQEEATRIIHVLDQEETDDVDVINDDNDDV